MATQFSNPDISKKKVLELTKNRQKISTNLEVCVNSADFQINKPEPDDNHPVMYAKNQGTDLNTLFSYQMVSKHPSTIYTQVKFQQYYIHNSIVAKTITKILTIHLETAVSP